MSKRLIIILTTLIFALTSSAEGKLKLFRSDGKDGFLNEAGEIVIPCQFELADNFSDGLANVKQNGKWGYIDKSGKFIIPCQFDFRFSFSEGLAQFKKDDKYGFIDISGNIVIPCKYDYASAFSEGLSAVKQNGEWGYINKSGNMVIPCKFENASLFHEGVAVVRQNNKEGYIDKNGNIVIPCQFDYAYSFKDGMAKVQKKSGSIGFIDNSGKLVIPFQFAWGYNFCEGLAAVKQNDKWGFIDKSGNFVIPCQFSDASDFSEGLAAVTQNGEWGYIDRFGKFVIPAQFYHRFDGNQNCFSDGLAPVWQNINKRGYIDRQGNFYDNMQMALGAIYSKKHRKYPQSFPAFIDAELGSFDAWLASKSLEPLTPEAVQAQVEKEIAAWQQKGEFESTAKWQQRVNEQTRADKAREIAGRITADYNARLDAARAEYRSRHEALAREYCDYHADKFADGDITLKPYDADNQTFLISTASYGDILLPVPVEEAPAFKSGWENAKKTVVAEFVPSGDGIAISSVRFGKYVYDSNTKATYTSVDVDYNFRPIDLAALDYNFGEIGSAGTAAPVSTPAAKAVAPRTYTPEHRKVTAGTASDIDTDIPAGTRKAPTTFAVIIANGDYAHASQVANAAADGRAVEQYLTRTLGIPAQNVTTYVNATYGQMASAMSHLRDIAAAYGEGNFSVLFYYVGHGLPDDTARESYILPVDVDPRNTEICYPLDRLYSQLGSLGASRVTVMVDACFSGANHGEGMLVPQSMGVTIKPKAASPSGNMIVLSAAEGDETAFPYAAKGHGLFTYWLLKKIRDTRGEVTLGELSDYVMENVRKTSVVENRKPQTPTVATSPSLTATWRSLPLAQ